jgi:oxygen-dependent protoporphyrinogen oxidase
MEWFIKRGVLDNDDESLASFVRRRFGREALERVAQPMIGGIYTADPEQLSLRATFPRFLEWERKYGSVIRALRRKETAKGLDGLRNQTSKSTQQDMSGARYSLFMSFDQGMQVLTDELSVRVPPATLRLNSHVSRLSCDHGRQRWHIESGNSAFAADAICLTTPAYVAANLLRETHSQLAAELGEVAYEASGTINLAYKRSQVRHALDGFGFVVPFIERRSLIACTFSSVKFPNRAPDDHVLLRAFVGGALQREIMQLDDSEIVSRVINDLSELLGINGMPLFTTFARWERSMPQYHVGHLARVERIKKYAETLPGLMLTGAAYSGVGIPDCIRSGETAAEEALREEQ